MFLLRYCLVSRYIDRVMWRKAIVVGLCVFCLGLSSAAGSAVPQMDRFQAEIAGTLSRLRGETHTHISLGHLEIFTTVEQMIPPNGKANLLSLIEILDREYSLWNPKEGRPVHIYFLDYKTFVEYSHRINSILVTHLWPGLKPSRPEDNYAFFVPLTPGEDVIITYTWEWSILLHELMHTVLFSQISLVSATNHGAIGPEVSRIWYSEEMQELVAKATKGERYE